MKDPISKWANDAQKRNSIEAQKEQSLHDEAMNALSNQYEFLNHLKKRDAIARDELDHAQEHLRIDDQRTCRYISYDINFNNNLNNKIIMTIVWMSAATAASYYLIIRKFQSLKSFLKTSRWWDVVLTIGIPLLFIGTISGMMTAILAGLFFTIWTKILKNLMPTYGDK